MEEGDRSGPEDDSADRTESLDDEGEEGYAPDNRDTADDPPADGEDSSMGPGPRELSSSGIAAVTARDPGEVDRSEASVGDPTEVDTELAGLLYRFRHDREGALMWIRELLSSVAIVLAIGLILFGVSGVWPPMVAVESGSMEPNMEVGDLVFVTEPGRLAPDAADNDVGVVTYENGETVDYRTFGSYGSVVIYRPPGRTASPIIHRAMFHVEEGENWYDRADDEYHDAGNCEELNHCPAPHDGFITLGDNNGEYDQANGLAAPVRAEWITGVARVRVPYLGYVRLIATGQAEVSDVLATTVVSESAASESVGAGDWPAGSDDGSRDETRWSLSALTASTPTVSSGTPAVAAE
ncbi:S26 family signal peptidase [Halorubrum sp. AD140]|uniref:S26 family signal peptidase n=1 Tax=Halorubrum sp. AD140 TaxID=3050073 RepID=UPI002ACCD8F7|nr:S26 family signal peptidase [Halorubrum sp. AD140]MDZ5810696.1 S26 family signal peptidase [Halorubrum sp. AD140]